MSLEVLRAGDFFYPYMEILACLVEPPHHPANNNNCYQKTTEHAQWKLDYHVLVSYCNGFYFRFSVLPEYREISLLLFVLFTSGAQRQMVKFEYEFRSFICKYKPN